MTLKESQGWVGAGWLSKKAGSLTWQPAKVNSNSLDSWPGLKGCLALQQASYPGTSPAHPCVSYFSNDTSNNLECSCCLLMLSRNQTKWLFCFQLWSAIYSMTIITLSSGHHPGKYLDIYHTCPVFLILLFLIKDEDSVVYKTAESMTEKGPTD